MRDRSVPSNLQANWIWGLHRDRGGEMWVASTTGLSRTRPQQDAILSLFSSDGSTWTDPYVFSVDADARGVVTLGQKSGIEIIDPAAAEDDRAAGRQRRRRRARRRINNVTAIVHTRRRHALDGLARRPVHAGARLAPDPGRCRCPQRGAVKAVTALVLDGSTLWIGGKGDGIWQMDLASPGHPLSPAGAHRAT